MSRDRSLFVVLLMAVGIEALALAWHGAPKPRDPEALVPLRGAYGDTCRYTGVLQARDGSGHVIFESTCPTVVIFEMPGETRTLVLDPVRRDELGTRFVGMGLAAIVTGGSASRE